MTAASKRGIVYTFYSFKGGVGRTMALANVAALLAKWGHSVLVVDWDLEAPGLERFFARLKPDIKNLRAAKPGILDLIEARKAGESLNWRDGLIEVSVNGKAASFSLLTAGRDDENYTGRLQSLDFPVLFDKHDLGAYIEELRDAWLSEFDFVLVDSRTGVTDIGGICTVHLADILVLLFTTTDSSTDGALQILERARNAQARLPLDRGRLLAVPVPARDESRTEHERAAQWKNEFAKRFSEVYRDWLPSSLTAHDAIELLRIPYVPYWSFGEQLPVIEGTSDPASLGHAYEILARIIAARLDWYVALEGQTFAPPPMPSPRELDAAWLARHRQAAREYYSNSQMTGYMEVWHFLPDSVIEKSQSELLAASTQAQVLAHGWPTGLVRDDSKSRPRSMNDGIEASVSPAGPHFAYWTLTRSGDFYTHMSLNEDHVDGFRMTIDPGARIGRATEVLLHCAKLYKLLGVQPNAHIELTARYCGLRGRTLSDGVQSRNSHEDEVPIPPITIKLVVLETEIVDIVKKLCEPLFVIFDFAQFSDDEYTQIVTEFLQKAR
jgi:cellulose biosynthesis protein BcsQ